MALYKRLDVLNEIVRIGLMPVFYQPVLETAIETIDALVAGGVRTIEFTNRGDNAYRVFSDLVLHYTKSSTDVILGVGSVLDPVTAALYIESGANFIVGPIWSEEVARTCNRRKISYSPGCGSATEITHAEELGVEIVKVFPGDSVGGPKFVKSILGPMPWTRIMPTGGVEATQSSIDAWFKAGVAAVGIGSDLVRKDWVKDKNFDAIRHKTEEVVAWIRQAHM